MSLDPTARKSNIRDSLKKYFIDNLYTSEGIDLTFDKTIATPKIQGHEVNRWVAITMNDILMGDLSTIFIDIYVCTRKDNEGFRLAQLRDTVYGYLVDSDQTDSMKRITFYRSRSNGAWTSLGGILIQEIFESQQMTTKDETKYKIITCKLRVASKV